MVYEPRNLPPSRRPSPTPDYATLDALIRFLAPRNVADVFIDTEFTLFFPILATGWKRGWWPAIAKKMDEWLL